MTTKRDARREDLKGRLIEAAQARIQSSGLAGLRARDITADAGCALGALYTAFADLDDLILHVNSDNAGAGWERPCSRRRPARPSQGQG